jgi:large subunit ribosomal protein L1
MVSRPAALIHNSIQQRFAAQKKSPNKYAEKRRAQKAATKRKKNARTTFHQYDLKDADQFALCDAMRYIRAAEVGRPATQVKYEVALKVKSVKNGPVMRNRLRLPHPVKTDLRICVICPPDSKHAEAARAAGAVLVGEEEVFEAIKDGKIEFDRCIAQIDSLPKMNKAALGRVLGPRGLMPSSKMGTVVKDPAAAVKEMVGGAEYRERLGVVRMAIGQLGFTPEMVQENIKVFVESVKKDMAQLSEKVNKEIAEVVLSSTNGPGMSLSGDFRSPTSTITPKDLTVL